MYTIQIDPTLFQQAERMAQHRHISVKQLIESFIRSHIERPQSGTQEVEITPFVKQLGCDLNLPADFDEKQSYRNYLLENI